MSSSSSSGAGGVGGGIVDECGPIGELGYIDLGLISLKFAHVVTICEKTIGFASLVTAPKEDEIIGIARLRPPTGDSVILSYAMANHATPVFFNYGWVLGANPQSVSADAYPVQAGKWLITLGDDDASIAKANTSVWYRRTSDGLFHGGVIDVNVFIAPGAATKNEVNEVLGKMFPFGGLGLGTVQFYDLASSYSVVSTQTELAQMMKESAGLTTIPALNLFVIGDFGAAFNEAIGVAGGIPGSPMQHGTGRSGLAYQPSGNTTTDASVLRHEAGHVAGLFHTTEIPNQFVTDETDPLEDTPSCAPDMIQNKPLSCPDVTNEMFPYAYGATAFTPQQDIIIQSSMLYRTIVKEGDLPVPPQPSLAPPSGASQLVPSDPSSAFEKGEEHVARRASKPLRMTDDPVERMLGSVWCARSGADSIELVIRAAGPDAPSRLRMIALDDGAPEFVRARALKAYARSAARSGSASTLKQAIDLATSLARNEAASTKLRVAALRSLEANAAHPIVARSALEAKRAFSTAVNPIVRAVALELEVP